MELVGQYDYKALAPPPVAPAQGRVWRILTAGLSGLALTALAASNHWRHRPPASTMSYSTITSQQSHIAHNGPALDHKPFQPREGVESVLVHPGPLSPLQWASAFSSSAPPPPTSLFITSPLLLQVQLPRMNMKEGWLYGARLYQFEDPAIPDRVETWPFVVPTGQSDDVVKGRVLSWEHEDDFHHVLEWLDESYSVKHRKHRGQVQVVLEDGTSIPAFYHYQPSLPGVTSTAGRYEAVKDNNYENVKAPARLMYYGFGGWDLPARTNDDLIDKLKRERVLVTPELTAAFRKVDRRLYCPTDASPYVDTPQSLGHGATISAPHMHALALEPLMDKLKPGAKVLDVGSGSGYLLAVMAHLVGPAGTVVGVEHIQELVDMSKKNMARDPGLAGVNNIQLYQGDGREGYAAAGPFDAIHVGAASPTTPLALLSQLAPGGKLVVPIGPDRGYQSLYCFTHTADGFEKERLMGVRYVPLTDQQQQRRWNGP